MEKDFDSWNNLKKKIESLPKNSSLFLKEGSVWMTALGKNIGFEQNGSGNNFSRPVLVLKKFNNQMFWCIPLSSKQKAFDFYYNFTDPQNTKVSAILAQMKLISIKRFERKIYDVSSILLREIKEKLKNLL